MIEAQALETLGSDLKKRGLRLLVHAHAPEMADHAKDDVDYKAIAAELNKLKYKGWLTTELAWDPTTPHTRSLGESLKRSREYIERTF